MKPADAPHEPIPTAATGTSAPRRQWRVFIPIALVLVLAAGWSGAWFYAADRAGTEIDAWIEREAAQGRVWTCGERELGGFPFRFELICAEPSVNFAGPGDWTLRMKRAHAVAQVWNPNHIIAEFEGPARLSEGTSGRELAAEWSLLQASGVGRDGQPERISVLADDYRLSESGTALFSAERVEMHLRHRAGEAQGTLDLATGFKGATGMAVSAPAGGQAPAGGSGVDGELEATVTGVPPFLPMSAQQRLALWQQAGGRVDLKVARVSGGGGALSAGGNIGLDARNRLEGRLDVAVMRAQPLFEALAKAGLMPDFLANLAPAMMMAGLPTTVDGAPASAFPFVFSNGRVALGLLPLGKIGPLF